MGDAPKPVLGTDGLPARVVVQVHVHDVRTAQDPYGGPPDYVCETAVKTSEELMYLRGVLHAAVADFEAWLRERRSRDAPSDP